MPKIKTQEEIIADNRKKNFKQKSIFFQQADFMKACSQTIDKLNHKQAALYHTLILEEFNEYNSVISESEAADAVIDLIVVLIGYGLSNGWPMQKLWDEVMASNMAKIDPATGKVKKRKDGKVLKPKDWKAPNIEFVLRHHEAKKKVKNG